MFAITTRENLTITGLDGLVARLGYIRGKVERAETREWIQRLGIHTSGPDAPIVTLSGGNQQKVVLAKWLRRGPKVLLLDEPTQGVDVQAKAAIHRLLREAAAAGAAVVIASSDDPELADVCDRVLVMRDGKIVAELTGQELTGAAFSNAQLAGGTAERS